ncbi:unnamed protein product, partial [Effrenium voratum]
ARYHILFQKSEQKMCLEQETDGCRRSKQACDISFCPVETEGCKCMLVRAKRCSDGETSHLQIFLESEVSNGAGTGWLSYFWRALRVKYVDMSPWGHDQHDSGRRLESELVCMTPSGCECQTSQWYRWQLDASKLKWAQGGGVSIGPHPEHSEGHKDLVSIRAFNNLHEVADMSFIKVGEGEDTSEDKVSEEEEVEAALMQHRVRHSG